MSHVRTQIRDRVVALLTPVATVYASRAYPTGEATLPVLLVFTNAEEIEPVAYALERRLELVVEAIAQATASLDSTVDTLISNVETAIAADPTLSGLVVECLPREIEITTSVEGAQPIGRARMTFEALYRTSSTDPQTAI